MLIRSGSSLARSPVALLAVLGTLSLAAFLVPRKAHFVDPPLFPSAESMWNRTIEERVLGVHRPHLVDLPPAARLKEQQKSLLPLVASNSCEAIYTSIAHVGTEGTRALLSMTDFHQYGQVVMSLNMDNMSNVMHQVATHPPWTFPMDFPNGGIHSSVWYYIGVSGGRNEDLDTMVNLIQPVCERLGLLHNCVHGFGHGLVIRKAVLTSKVPYYSPCMHMVKFDPSWAWFQSVEEDCSAVMLYKRACGSGAWHGFFMYRTNIDVPADLDFRKHWIYPCDRTSMAKECFHFKLIFLVPWLDGFVYKHPTQWHNLMAQRGTLGDLCTALPPGVQRNGCFFGLASFLFRLFATTGKCEEVVLNFAPATASPALCPLLSRMPATPTFHTDGNLGLKMVDFCTRFTEPLDVTNMSQEEHDRWIACAHGSLYKNVEYDTGGHGVAPREAICSGLQMLKPGQLDPYALQEANETLCTTGELFYGNLYLRF